MRNHVLAFLIALGVWMALSIAFHSPVAGQTGSKWGFSCQERIRFVRVQSANCVAQSEQCRGFCEILLLYDKACAEATDPMFVCREWEEEDGGLVLLAVTGCHWSGSGNDRSCFCNLTGYALIIGAVGYTSGRNCQTSYGA